MPRPAATSLTLAPYLFLSALALGVVMTPPSAARAQETVSPYFMVLLDTSGSMDDRTLPAGSLNSCGFVARKMSDARCVLQSVFNNYGEVSFGLATFNTLSSGGTISGTCTHGTCGCTGNTSTCDETAASGRIRVPITPDNQPTLLSWVDYTGGGSCTTSSGMGTGLELRNHGATPLEGSLRAVQRYYIGNDPTFGDSPLEGDPFVGCRSVNVILLTDGEETCSGEPDQAATLLRSTMIPGVGTVDIRTYVIGFGIAPGNAQIEDIADAGGTNQGYYATDETSLALAFSQIIAAATRTEICDGDDDDCDTRIDEGFPLFCNAPGHPARDLCAMPTETLCDGVDNNCNGTTDEGLRNACGTCGPAPTEICNRVDDNCNGAIDEGMVCGGCTPNTEGCNNTDDDCDGRVDELLTRPCGTDTGECSAGTQTCAAGAWGTCSGTGPVLESCNNRDDDCDGVIDGMIQSCGIDTGACQSGSQVCTTGMYGMCVGTVGPSTELCNNVDDDCDGTTDDGNPGGGAACGSSIGVCRPGTLRCLGGALSCTGGTSGSTETCDLEDDDCDGRTDEGNPGGGASCGTTDVGACAFGTIRCIGGALVCDGAVGPLPERCNGIDDNCNGEIDEGNPEGGASCGDDTGECLRGTTRCIGGTLTCDGSIGPAMETCNGLDDDCDGGVDDEIPVGAACGSDVGECDPGIFACDAATGTTVCVGETGPTDEACNLLDDDCDGMTDEALPDGAACGLDEGACMAGVLRCVDGAEICIGEVPPGTEVCDCEDNDCDGSVDEEASGALCPGGSACVECQCASECMETEFGFNCPGGRTPQVVGALCYCVEPRCDETSCNGETLVGDDGTTVTCSPDASDVAPCTCRNNDCTFPCDGVMCSGGTVCDPRDPEGRCVEDNCRGLGCPDGEVCDFASGACTADPCETAGCAADEGCRDGACITSCADVECGDAELCRDGACVTDECAGVTCRSGEVCDPADGSCVTNECMGRVCGTGFVCEPTTGDCVENPCNGVRCPDMQMCQDGECVREIEMPDGGMGGVDAGMGRMDAGEEPRRVLASGGNLCSASVGRSADGTAGWLLAMAGLAIALRRRASAATRAAVGGSR